MYRQSCKASYTKGVNFLTNIRGNVHRQYHSDNVFGFKRKIKKNYQAPKEVDEIRCRESNFYRLVTAYRQHGHKYSQINPVSLEKPSKVFPELDFSRYGFRENDKVQFNGIINVPAAEGSIKEAVEFLSNTYCKTVAAEYLHLEEEEEIEWLTKQLEKLPQTNLQNEEKIEIASHLLKSQCFEQFMAKKFTSVKRYGGEGAQSILVFYSELFKLAAKDNVEEIVVVMSHRGRLSVLTGLLNVAPVDIFNRIKGNPEYPPQYQSSGDAMIHISCSSDLVYDDKSLHVTLLNNPSHLEVPNPVSMGKTRAKQLVAKDGDYGDRRWGDKILNVQAHGDAAFIAQGLNQECLSFTYTPHFDTGGCIHLITNNQVGFTTPSDRGRSSRYATDLAKMISAPVIHVNGECPEDVLKATRIAVEYQRKFRKHIFIDINCYRRHGHNELDDPTFTNPVLYSIIKSKKTLPDSYKQMLIDENILAEEDCQEIVRKHETWLNEQLKASDNYEPKDIYFKKNWEGMVQPGEVITTWDTGIDYSLMTLIGTKSVEIPGKFAIHPTLLKNHVKNRVNKVSHGKNIDWPTAEALAFGSLLLQGHNVRISGQDVGRGTFSQRHAMLVDQQTNELYIPLNNIHENQTGFLEIANSVLSEEAVVGFEYGMSIEDPRNLIIWEAQFGDFFNGGQVMYDTYISCGEAKWLWQCGLTILLPHGYDGAGADHSTARLERFLQLTDSKEDKVDGDNINMQVCQPSTPAQYFHLLRRQIVRNFRKPLIVITPKTLLRHPTCVSDFTDMMPGTYFKPVLGDATVDPYDVRKILITSGKHYYSLAEKRGSLEVKDTAIITLESFCPFPAMELKQEIDNYPNAKVIVWCQEEPRNMGAWTFVKSRFENLLGRRITYCGRDTLAATAVGIGKVHQQQVNEVASQPFLI